MQSKNELENWWSKEDAWGYRSNKDDLKRKEVILSVLDSYERALDIGAGEGFITEDLPAKSIEALEISDNASQRLKGHIKRTQNPEGFYDLIVATGVLYKQYDFESMVETIRKHASRHILIAGIEDWLIPFEFGELVSETTFPYRDYQQVVRLYEITP